MRPLAKLKRQNRAQYLGVSTSETRSSPAERRSFFAESDAINWGESDAWEPQTEYEVSEIDCHRFHAG